MLKLYKTKISIVAISLRRAGGLAMRRAAEGRTYIVAITSVAKYSYYIGMSEQRTRSVAAAKQQPPNNLPKN
jgi:hypothetical protein